MPEKDILTEIVDRRNLDISSLGYNFGVNIPEKRSRPITPFIDTKGAILEIKRASPSKGDIAPNLDVVSLTETYIQAGAAAISVLTEKNYFKGSLEDLLTVTKTVDRFCKEHPQYKKPAILRKDFLTDEQEIQIAYNAGADAVLLIARILPTSKLISMAKKCRQLGITAFMELRLDEDLQKLQQVVNAVNTKYIVTGVNARDLRTFTIDLLTPCAVVRHIRQIAGDNMAVVFESGIRTPQAAHFAGSLGFTGMLLGEAAAKNPSLAKSLVTSFVNGALNANTKQWLDYADKQYNRQARPLIKICGLTNAEDALAAADTGANLLGFIFCKKSPRNVSEQTVRDIKLALSEHSKENVMPKLVGVVTDTTSEESKNAINLANEGLLDLIQLHGKTAYTEFFANEELRDIAHYCVVNVKTPDDLRELDKLIEFGEPRILIDSQVGETIGGTGMRIENELIGQAAKKIRPWIAGGITPQNITEVINEFNPELIDISSGTEHSPGKKDHGKLNEIKKLINKSNK